MSILGSITDIFTGGLAGGITGIIGSIGSAFMNYKMKKLEYQHEIDMGNMRIKIANSKVQGEVEKSEAEARKESYKEISNTFFKASYFKELPSWTRPVVAIMFALLDFIRGIIRPLLTIYLSALVFWIGYNTYLADNTAFTSSAKELVTIVLYLAVMTYSWWFCDRKIEKFIQDKLK